MILNKFSILGDKEIEISTKYFLMCLLMEFGDSQSHSISLCDDFLSSLYGISKPRIYRARSQLIKLGVLKLTKKFCSDTGKRSEDLYEFI